MDRDDLFGRDRGWRGDERYRGRRRGWELERDRDEARRSLDERDRERYPGGYRRDAGDYGDLGPGYPNEWREDDSWRERGQGYRRELGGPWPEEERWRQRSEGWGRPGEGWRGRGEGWRGRERSQHPPWSDDYYRDQERRWRREELGPGAWLREVVEGYGMPHHDGHVLERLRTRFSSGPKGYRRSDERIHEDICEALVDQPWIDASDVEVKVENAEVTLTGTAPDRRYKREIEDVAHGVRGVIDVHNRIRVQREEGRPEGQRAEGESTPDEKRRPNPRA
jgi:hypothetical protein